MFMYGQNVVMTWCKPLLQEYATQNLDLYYDTHTQWDRVYGDDVNLTSCREKESVLQVNNRLAKICQTIMQYYVLP